MTIQSRVDEALSSARDPLNDPRFRIAAARRILYNNGLDSLIGGHVSMRGDEDTLWITPVQYFDQTLPSDVCRLTFDGEVVEGGGLKRSPGIGFHPAIYRARPDVNCVIHTHAFYLAVLSTQEAPLGVYHDHGAYFLDEVAYLQESLEFNPIDSSDQLAAALGDKSVLLLRQHGSINVADSIEEATGAAVLLEWTAKHHLASVAAGGVEMDRGLAAWYQQAYRQQGAAKMLWEQNLQRLHGSDPGLFAAL